MTTNPILPPEQRTAITEAIYAGRKIEAIKELRNVSGLGLRESKEVVETIERELRVAHPERFAGTASKAGCGSAAVFLVALAVPLAIVCLR
ncbi:MAG: ribosomal protein L7/L12 [Planctomycetes bacterium]|nr:ribosomal protein L7/L12 [Planctomycetota bacterium]